MQLHFEFVAFLICYTVLCPCEVGHLHFVGEETAMEKEVTCLMSHSKSEFVGEYGIGHN